MDKLFCSVSGSCNNLWESRQDLNLHPRLALIGRPVKNANSECPVHWTTGQYDSTTFRNLTQDTEVHTRSTYPTAQPITASKSPPLARSKISQSISRILNMRSLVSRPGIKILRRKGIGR